MRAQNLVVILACAVSLGGCAGAKELLAKCSADENPVGALAFADNKKQTNAGVLVVQQMADECGAMQPVNQF